MNPVPALMSWLFKPACPWAGLRWPHDQAKASALRAKGRPPDPQTPLPQPEGLERFLFGPSLPDAPFWNALAAPEGIPSATPTASAPGLLTPWAWAWGQHPDGLSGLVAWANEAIDTGDALALEALGKAWPPTLEGTQAWGGLLPRLWKRPPAPHLVFWFERGDWRHTLALWQVWHQAPACPKDHEPTNASWEGWNGWEAYVGTAPHRCRWRQAQFRAWAESDLPKPSLALALRLSGFFPFRENAWSFWLEEGFDDPRSVAAQDCHRQAQALWDFLVAWLAPDDRVRAQCCLAWMTASRGESGGAPCSDGWQELEKSWAFRLAAPLPSPPEQGWLHALAQSPGAHRLGIDVLQTIPWEASDPEAFQRRWQGLTPSEQWAHTIAQSALGAGDLGAAHALHHWLQARLKHAQVEAWGPGHTTPARARF